MQQREKKLDTFLPTVPLSSITHTQIYRPPPELSDIEGSVQQDEFGVEIAIQILHLHPTDFAQQLCLSNQNVYQKINHSDFIHYLQNNNYQRHVDDKSHNCKSYYCSYCCRSCLLIYF